MLDSRLPRIHDAQHVGKPRMPSPPSQAVGPGRGLPRLGHWSRHPSRRVGGKAAGAQGLDVGWAGAAAVGTLR
eukprot:1403384-Alexandrium_andersonii.AAC.1